jgi:hypothetical protein
VTYGFSLPGLPIRSRRSARTVRDGKENWYHDARDEHPIVSSFSTDIEPLQ